MVYDEDYSADQLVVAYALTRYQTNGRNLHLRQCPEATAAHVVGSDGSYGCDTGCEYLRFEIDVTCPHGEIDNGWEWGEFGEMADLIQDIHAP